MIAVVGAMSYELKPFLASVEQRRRRAGGVDGRCGGVPVRVVMTGDGADAARSGLHRALEPGDVRRVLVFGVSGGLDPALAEGQLVLAGTVADADGELEADPVELQRARTAVPGLLPGATFTADRIALDPEEKSGVWTAAGRRAGGTVDLESSAYVRTCCHHGVAWTVVRAVLDPAGETLPMDMNRFREPGGSIRQGAIARHVAFRPVLAARLIEYQRRLGRVAEAAVPVIASLIDAGSETAEADRSSVG